MLSVELVRGFKQQDVILVAMDRDGAKALLAALERAATDPNGQASVGRGYDVRIVAAGGAASIDLDQEHSVWRLSRSILDQMAGQVQGLLQEEGPGHHYVDISEPVPTLVLSLDEYGPVRKDPRRVAVLHTGHRSPHRGI